MAGLMGGRTVLSMIAILLAGLISSCAPATGKGHDYVVYTARRGSVYSRVQVTLPIEKVCATSPYYAKANGIRLVHETTGTELISFDFKVSSCQKPGRVVLQELFDNGTDYTLVAERERGPDLRMPLLDRDPLTGQDL